MTAIVERQKRRTDGCGWRKMGPKISIRLYVAQKRNDFSRVVWTRTPRKLHPTHHGVTMVILKPCSLGKDGK
jgi:hypothetical protein